LGAIVYENGNWYSIVPRKINVLDRIGGGDVLWVIAVCYFASCRPKNGYSLHGQVGFGNYIPDRLCNNRPTKNDLEHWEGNARVKDNNIIKIN
jgi:hypothetical protein